MFTSLYIYVIIILKNVSYEAKGGCYMNTIPQEIIDECLVLIG